MGSLAYYGHIDQARAPTEKRKNITADTPGSLPPHLLEQTAIAEHFAQVQRHQQLCTTMNPNHPLFCGSSGFASPSSSSSFVSPPKRTLTLTEKILRGEDAFGIKNQEEEEIENEDSRSKKKKKTKKKKQKKMDSGGDERASPPPMPANNNANDRAKITPSPHQKKRVITNEPNSVTTMPSVPPVRLDPQPPTLGKNNNAELITKFEATEQLHQKRLKDIQAACEQEKKAAMQSIDCRCLMMMNQAEQEFVRYQQMLPVIHPKQTAECAICKSTIVTGIPRARCVGTGSFEESQINSNVPCPLDAQLCSNCYRTALGPKDKCICCPSMLANFVCVFCQTQEKKAGSRVGYEYCQNDCGHICPQHTTYKTCHGCGKSHSVCKLDHTAQKQDTDSCMKPCSSCGRTLCRICLYRGDGCPCRGAGTL